jgi:hypothetical protein
MNEYKISTYLPIFEQNVTLDATNDRERYLSLVGGRNKLKRLQMKHDARDV